MLSMTLRNCRTLPGQANAASFIRAGNDMPLIDFPCRLANKRMKCSMRSGMSADRSRSEGMAIVTTLSRW